MSAPLLCVAGPTASGKSAVALAIADVLPVEIVSVDSAQVYRGMDIGTAKPGPVERAAVPHHLLDIVDPAEPYSAARFVDDVRTLLPAIRDRGRIPLLVGGTMLYFKALFDGLDPLPAADAAVRAEIDALAAAGGWPAVHAELARVDPASAARLQPNDRQRLQRALEVYRVSGRPLSALQQRASRPRDPALPPLLALEPADRGWLHARIGERFDAMLAGGLLAEVQALRARTDLHAGLPSMRAVGYRQAWQLLDAVGGDAADADAAALRRFREQAVAATRQLAKRQLTWLRSMAQREVVACDAADAQAQALAWARRRAAQQD